MLSNQVRLLRPHTMHGITEKGQSDRTQRQFSYGQGRRTLVRGRLRADLPEEEWEDQNFICPGL